MRKLLYLLISAAIVAGDQLVKWQVSSGMELYESRVFIPGLVRLIYVQNTGAAFGVLGGARWILIAVSSAAVAAAVWVAAKGAVSGVFGLASLATLVGGAAGNLVDRVRQGFVVDMFEFEFVKFAIFNVADIFVTIGGIGLCAYMLFFYGKQRGVPAGADGREDPAERENA